ncbi:MAG: carboxypeptidase-like regulatory domain-containing protein [Methanobrevibacter sp.]|nr:carboxypeptidase-like regulatory domain-containing protein [Methanobrevibacter sp.]
MHILILIGATLLIVLSLNTSFAASLDTEKMIINSSIMHDDVIIGEIVNITGILTDENGNAVGNTLVTIIVDGKTHVAMTDSEGRWILSYQTIRTGIIKTSVSLDESDIYVGFNNCAFFKVYNTDDERFYA